MLRGNIDKIRLLPFISFFVCVACIVINSQQDADIAIFLVGIISASLSFGLAMMFILNSSLLTGYSLLVLSFLAGSTEKIHIIFLALVIVNFVYFKFYLGFLTEKRQHEIHKKNLEEQRKAEEQRRVKKQRRVGKIHNTRTYDKQKFDYIPDDVRKAFEILELPASSSYEQARKKKTLLLKFYHPDHHCSDKNALDYATQKTKEVNRAFDILEKHHFKTK